MRDGVPLESLQNHQSGANPNANEPADPVLVSSEGHLLVGQARLAHQANYTCVAENVAAKRTSEPASITVYG